MAKKKMPVARTETVHEEKPRAKDGHMGIAVRGYRSVSEMVRDNLDPAFADDFDRSLSERRLVRALTVMRCRRGLTQADLGERMACGQAKISKVETSRDLDLNLGDVLQYCGSLGLAMHVVLTPARDNGADRIRFHINVIKHELNRLVALAGNDPDIGAGVEAFAVESLRKIIELFEGSLSGLPNRNRTPSAALEVDIEGDRGERVDLDNPGTRRRVRKSKEQRTPA